MSDPVTVTVTDARNRFGQLCQQAKRAPVVIEKAGRPDSVLMSYGDYQRLIAPAAAASMASPSRAFNAELGTWLDAVNAQQDADGLWNDDLRLW